MCCNGAKMREYKGELIITADERKFLDNMECPKPPYTTLRPVKAGFLTKQGGAFKTWKKRLVALQDQWLFYYVDAYDKGPRGVLYIGGCTASEQPEVSREKQTHCFSVTCKRSWNLDNNKTFAQRTYLFCTSSAQDMSDWIAIITTMAIPPESESITGSNTGSPETG